MVGHDYADYRELRRRQRCHKMSQRAKPRKAAYLNEKCDITDVTRGFEMTTKQRITVSLPDEVVEQVRTRGINVSATIGHDLAAYYDICETAHRQFAVMFGDRLDGSDSRQLITDPATKDLSVLEQVVLLGMTRK